MRAEHHVLRRTLREEAPRTLLNDTSLLLQSKTCETVFEGNMSRSHRCCVLT